MNQDFLFASDEPVGQLPNLYIVADGMGGHRAGDYASRYAVTQMVEQVRQQTSRNIRDILDVSLHNVNAGLHRTSRMVEAYRGCGTTMVLCVVAGSVLHAANVGDSRLYLVGKDITQITVDHSLVEEMVLSGTLDEKRARTHPEKNVITRAVGVEDYIDVDFFTSDLHRGDRILLCTDGLTNMLENEEILRILQSESPLSGKAQELVDEANKRGGPDNISAMIIDPFAEHEPRK